MGKNAGLYVVVAFFVVVLFSTTLHIYLTGP